MIFGELLILFIINHLSCVYSIRYQIVKNKIEIFRVNKKIITYGDKNIKSKKIKNKDLKSCVC